ncbi:hypothetical protein SDC9_133464 [bioreactor metagenome]|uniref:Uncharacterized protein n=1 Tax=bioreactor metagenome TaxID=1076179 RepID=A0A645DAV7_9ZZZZ
MQRSAYKAAAGQCDAAFIKLLDGKSSALIGKKREYHIGKNNADKREQPFISV